MLIEVFDQTFKIKSQKGKHILPYSVTHFLKYPPENETI